jgi:uncharacterized protein YecA (UPF0149 family)
MSALDLDLLSEYLDGDQNEYGLDFAATHGFLCAIAVGPTFAKWLDELFDNNQKKVTLEQLDEVAEKALNDGSIIYNPKEASLKDLKAILEKAW